MTDADSRTIDDRALSRAMSGSRPMRRAWIRVASWVGLALIVSGLAYGARQLPGAGGLTSELRWQMNRERIYGRQWNAITRLVWLAEERNPGITPDLVMRLIDDPNSRVARRAMLVLAQAAMPPGQAPGEDPALRAVYEHWLNTAGSDAKLAALRATLVGSRAFARSQASADVSNLPLREHDWRWRLAASVRGPMFAEGWGERLIFRDTRRPGGIYERIVEIVHQCDLSALVDYGSTHGGLPPIPLDRLCDEVHVPVDVLVDALDDANPAVRIAAGRILAVAGDRRALAAAREWLQMRRCSPSEQLTILAGLFGEDALDE